MPKTHINITIDPDLLAEVDKDARRMYLNRSQYIEYCARRMIEARRFMKANPTLMQQMAQIEQTISDISMEADKDFAGVFGQTSLADLKQTGSPSKPRKK